MLNAIKEAIATWLPGAGARTAALAVFVLPIPIFHLSLGLQDALPEWSGVCILLLRVLAATLSVVVALVFLVYFITQDYRAALAERDLRDLTAQTNALTQQKIDLPLRE